MTDDYETYKPLRDCKACRRYERSFGFAQSYDDPPVVWEVFDAECVTVATCRHGHVARLLAEMLNDAPEQMPGNSDLHVFCDAHSALGEAWMESVRLASEPGPEFIARLETACANIRPVPPEAYVDDGEPEICGRGCGGPMTKRSVLESQSDEEFAALKGPTEEKVQQALEEGKQARIESEKEQPIVMPGRGARYR